MTKYDSIIEFASPESNYLESKIATDIFWSNYLGSNFTGQYSNGII